MLKYIEVLFSCFIIENIFLSHTDLYLYLLYYIYVYYISFIFII
jgi:hypothetical protein